MSHDPVVWVGALCTLAIFSLLYRENPVYRFFEYLFVGLAAGYTIVLVWRDTLARYWWEPMTQRGEWWWMLPFLLGLLYFTIYVRRLAWMNRWLIGMIMGVAAGQFFQALAQQYLPQIKASVKPIGPSAGLATSINNAIILVTLVSVMVYFLFSFEHRAWPVRRTAQVGRWLLMMSFGAIFGSTVMARMALAVSRLYFLLHNWLGWVS